MRRESWRESWQREIPPRIGGVMKAFGEAKEQMDVAWQVKEHTREQALAAAHAADQAVAAEAAARHEAATRTGVLAAAEELAASKAEMAMEAARTAAADRGAAVAAAEAEEVAQRFAGEAAAAQAEAQAEADRAVSCLPSDQRAALKLQVPCGRRTPSCKIRCTDTTITVHTSPSQTSSRRLVAQQTTAAERALCAAAAAEAAAAARKIAQATKWAEANARAYADRVDAEKAEAVAAKARPPPDPPLGQPSRNPADIHTVAVSLLTPLPHTAYPRPLPHVKSTPHPPHRRASVSKSYPFRIHYECHQIGLAPPDVATVGVCMACPSQNPFGEAWACIARG